MAAVGIHVARLTMKPIRSGSVLNKESATIQEMIGASSELRIIPDSLIANTSGWPTMEAYLKLEAADGYVANHISQNMIVTYKAADLNV